MVIDLKKESMRVVTKPIKLSSITNLQENTKENHKEISSHSIQDGYIGIQR